MSSCAFSVQNIPLTTLDILLQICSEDEQPLWDKERIKEPVTLN